MFVVQFSHLNVFETLLFGLEKISSLSYIDLVALKFHQV